MLTLTPASAWLLTGSETSSGRAGGPHSPEVRALLESGPRAAAHSPLAERNGFLRLQLLGYRASFLMSTLRNLAHFLEDDTTPQVLPMEISVRDTHVNLKVRIVSCCATMARMLFSFLNPKFQLYPEAVVAVCLLAILQSHTCPIFRDGVAVIGLISHCRTVEQVSITPLKILNRGVIGLCLCTECLMSPVQKTWTCFAPGCRSPGQRHWIWALAHHRSRGQPDHTQTRRRLFLRRRWGGVGWWRKCSSFHRPAFLKFFPWFPADTAAEKRPRKEAALTDGSLSPVPESTSSIHRVSKATQTQPSSASPSLSREKVSSALLWFAVGNTEFVLNLSHYNLTFEHSGSSLTARTPSKGAC